MLSILVKKNGKKFVGVDGVVAKINLQEIYKTNKKIYKTNKFVEKFPKFFLKMWSCQFWTVGWR